MFVGYIIHIMLGTLSMLAIDLYILLAVHLRFVDDDADLGIGSHCMFTHTKYNSAHTLT